MTITVLYFAQIAEKVGYPKEKFELKDAVTSSELNSILVEKYPQIAEQEYKMAVNQVLIQSDNKLQDGDEIALLPPFAGG